jgi:hypothetical protein
MATNEGAADEILAHSEDEGEWEDEAERIESRPSGSQVISARLPTVLAERLLSEASRRAVRPSELVREAVEALLRDQPGGVAGMVANTAGTVRVALLDDYRTENRNPVVEPPEVEVVPIGL